MSLYDGNTQWTWKLGVMQLTCHCAWSTGFVDLLDPCCTDLKKTQRVQVVELHTMRVDHYPTCEGSIAGCWSLIISTMESWKSSLHSPDPVIVAPISTCGLNNSTSRSLWRWIHWDPWLVSDYLWNMTTCQESSWSFLDIVTAWTNSYGLIYI